MDLIAGACAAVRQVAIKIMIEKRGKQRLKYLVLSHQAIFHACYMRVQFSMNLIQEVYQME